MQDQFIRVHNKLVRLDSIGYIDFLESGRSMIFVPGLSHEKQNIPVDEAETRKLRAELEGFVHRSSGDAGGIPDEGQNHERRPAGFGTRLLGLPVVNVEKDRLLTCAAPYIHELAEPRP